MYIHVCVYDCLRDQMSQNSENWLETPNFQILKNFKSINKNEVTAHQYVQIQVHERKL